MEFDYRICKYILNLIPSVFIAKYFKDKSWVRVLFAAEWPKWFLGASYIRLMVLLYAVKSHYYTSAIIPPESATRYGGGHWSDST